MKKWLCLVSIVVFCIALSNIAFATTLKDVKGTKYENSVLNLIDVGLVNGYEDGTYRPNTPVTRAQMAKLMVISLGEEKKVTAASTRKESFSDINSKHWAYGYVNVAKDIGIINGYTDGTFDPDATVSYAEATAMAVRALGFEEKVKQYKKSWPDNYITCADELKLLKNISLFDNNSGAARGDVAILLWNMLNTGVSKVTAQNSNGLVYGPGELMLVKYKNYIYMDDGEITAVDFDKDYENATVTISGSSKVKLSFSDTDVFKYLGKKITILYNSNSKKIVSIDSEKKYKGVTGDVTKVTSSKIYIDDESYTLPNKGNIFLYKVDDLSDAIEATVYTDGKDVKYVLAKGAKDVEIGLVTVNNKTVNKNDGIEIKRVGYSSTSSYELVTSREKPSKYSVILYYLNDDNKIRIIKEIEEDDAKSISSISSSKLKVNGKTYEYDSAKCLVYSATSSNIKTLSFKNIDEDDDLVYVYEYAGKTYFVVFEDAVEDSSSKNTKYKDLQSYIDKVASAEKSEPSYSQKSYADFIEALDDARSIKSSATVSKIETALDNLKEAYSDLKYVSSSSTEGKIAKKRAELRALVNGEAKDIVDEKDKYIESSFNKFNKYLNSAYKVLRDTSSTLSEVTDAYDELKDSIKNDLEAISNTPEHKTAVEELNLAIGKAEKLISQKASYTETSYNALKTAYDSAKSINNNASSKTTDEIKLATQKLNTAIGGLQFALDSLKDELNKLIGKYFKIYNADDDYTTDTFSKFKTAYENASTVVEGTDINKIKQAYETLKTTKDALKNVDEELNGIIKKVEKMKTATNVASALGMEAKTSTEKMNKIDNIKSAVKEDLKDLIKEGNDKAYNSVEKTDGTLDSALGDAKGKLYASSSSIEELVNAYTNLKAAIKK